MRTIRTLITLSMVLAVGLSTASIALAQTDPKAPASFVGWVLDESHVDSGTAEDLGSVLERRDLAYSYDFDSSDPRMSGTGLWMGNGDRYRAEPLFELQTARWVITNDEGSWEGIGTGLRGTGGGDNSTLVLEGTGAYDGMSAYLGIDWNLGGGTIQGAIFPGTIPDAP